MVWHVWLLARHCKEIKPVNHKGNQPWIFIGRTDAEAETPILWPPYAKNSLIGKDPDAGRDWRWEEKGTTEDEMVGWHHWLDGHEFEQALGEAWRVQSMGSQRVGHDWATELNCYVYLYVYKDNWIGSWLWLLLLKEHVIQCYIPIMILSK